MKGAMEPGGVWAGPGAHLAPTQGFLRQKGKAAGGCGRGRGGMGEQDCFARHSTKPRTWSRALVAVSPARAVTVPASSSRQPRTVSVWLEPFWATCSCGPGVTGVPLRSQVTLASGGDTSQRNVASSPSWTVSGVSSESSFTGGGSGRRLGVRPAAELGAGPAPSLLSTPCFTFIPITPLQSWQPQGCPTGPVAQLTATPYSRFLSVAS